VNPERTFDGQRFCRSEAATANWHPWRIAGFEARETGIGAATGGVASVQVVRPTAPAGGSVTSHTSDILFTFVLSGSLVLHGEGQGAHPLEAGDAFVIPPNLKTSLTDTSADLHLLEVSLPARFDTHVHRDVHR
jgi:quercetin dioxygenase-like cupin family protein